VTVSGGFDVAGRLAEGVPSVEHIGTYVWACRQLGYQHPDLTAHPAQIRDWYGHEDGLDLRALDTDRAALSAAATAADDALTRHTVLTAELAGAWSGTGAGAAREFLRRQGQSAIDVRDGLRHAADAVAALRDELWRAVDAKVGTVLDIDDRRQAQRAKWLAAAQTVTSGAGDRAAASELVDQQIKPFVDNDIRSDWLAAMHRAMASVTEAYGAALAGVGGGSAASFDVPGELGPRWEEPPWSTTHGATAPGATAPAAAFTPTPVASGAPPASVAEPVPPTPGPPAPAPAAAAAPLTDPMSAGAGPAAPPSMPSFGTGASGVGQQLADLIGGLLGSSDNGSSESADLDPAAELDPIDDTESADGADDSAEVGEEGDAGEGEAEEDQETAEDGDAAEDPDAAEEQEAAEETETETDPEPQPAATPVPPQPEPAPPIPPAVPEAAPAAKTPCEIAADELPQVGE
jgi:hypothetical protein